MNLLVPGGSVHNLLINRGYFLINWKSPMLLMCWRCSVDGYVCLFLVRRAGIVERYPSVAEKGWLEKIMPKKDPVQILKWCVVRYSSGTVICGIL